MVLGLLRVVVVALAGLLGFSLGPALGLPGPSRFLAIVGVGFGILTVLIESRARRIPVDRLFWGTAGALAGLLVGLALGTALAGLIPGGAEVGRGLLGPLFAYVGLVVTLAKREELDGLSARLFPKAAVPRQGNKILDTSVIIDGRITDVCETGFLEGTLVVPQFVLRELQQIADSSDALKRNRGKRGFEVLQRLQRIPEVTVLVHDGDFPQVREVDRKLIELAKAMSGKVVTNDYNLNKVAELSGVEVLNINELANALKPVLLPGESIHLYVLKEGKEAGQGIAYLDDGTMVVIDHGKRLIGQTVDVTVTSVLQTTAGRMIFARPAPIEEHVQPR